MLRVQKMNNIAEQVQEIVITKRYTNNRLKRQARPAFLIWRYCRTEFNFSLNILGLDML